MNIIDNKKEVNEMPVIFVYGLPEDIEHLDIVDLYDALLEEVLGIKELNLQSHQVTLFFPQNRLKDGLGEEIVIFIKGLMDKPERTDEVRQKLAERLKTATQVYFPEARLVECFIEPFNQLWGFSSSNP